MLRTLWPGVEAGALGQVRGQALGLRRLLGRRGESRGALSAAGHDLAKEVAGAVPDRGRLRRRGAVVRGVAGGAGALGDAHVELALQAVEAFLVAVDLSRVARQKVLLCQGDERDLLSSLLLEGDVLLLELVDLLADELHLLDLCGD